jgi:hypothetical protein
MMLRRRPPDRTKPTPGGDVGLGRADTTAESEGDRSVKGDMPQWAARTSPRLVAIVAAHRQAFPCLALSRDIQLAIAREWSAT